MNLEEMPLPMKINNASDELSLSIFNIQKKYGFPSYLIELIINRCMTDIKTCATNELINEINKKIEKTEKKESEK